MSRGIVLFAHNSEELDYIQMAMIAGGLAKKNLNLPVSLITDKASVAWAKKSKIYSRCKKIFDKIILIPAPPITNKRRLSDGTDVADVPFINATRSSAYALTPYDQTLLIDTDFLIFTDNLNKYWDLPSNIKISSAINDIYHGNRLGYNDLYISDTGVHLYWATTVMFNKSNEAELFFNLVDVIRENYAVYGEVYRFSTVQYRNDIAFSVAKHIMQGYSTDISNSLPPVFSAIDRDVLHSVTGNKLLMLINDVAAEAPFAVAVQDADIHVMNKQSIIRNAKQLLELI